ncbi:methyltransferase domain-containing protein [Rhodobacterales bacterium]|nr:methyltransferase domain-containing protein [Rhodobacterales bacterium]
MSGPTDQEADGTTAPSAASRSPDDWHPPFRLRLRQWRNRLIGSPGFRSRLQRFHGTRWLARRKSNDLFWLTAGFVFSQVLSACVSLRILEKLRDTRLTTATLADGCGVPLDRMRLLLEQAERLGLVMPAGRDGWILDDAGTVVASDPGLAAMVEHHALFYRDLEKPAELFASGPTDTELRRYWAYTHGQETAAVGSDVAHSYSQLMRHSQSMLAECILAAHDFGHYDTILDVGGGDGSFLAAAATVYPALRLHLFDLPPVIELARANLADRKLADRAELHSGDFANDTVPDSADCVCLIRVLCDHDDARVLQILANLRRSLKRGTRIMIAEAMAGRSEGAQLAAVYFSLYFLAMGSGRCRTDTQIKELLDAAGFRRPHTVATPNPLLATLVFAER